MKVKSDPQQLFKEIMGSYPTGVTVITTLDENNKPVGLTVNSFASVSIDPLMVLWCIDKNAGSCGVFKKADNFAVNILAGNQQEVCWTFASKSEPDRFAKHPWVLSENNLPVINNVFASFECKKVQMVDAGDHYILIGEVIDLNKNEQEPMLYFRRKVGNVPENWA
ncbi:flavin reductase family protein [Mesobacillus maritimus]|uniref:flavin reductase family protein n=1 Tax=Mesobacillus maritimus TaxID=1643336 RepID=UPI00203C871E|nr:flavin reductase family protein [Mesobacillus maritimus]MCM3587872.1 flavin reductase family protein [Mesobacillus maritimus]MCM3671801.1 flavin reductase family protein [Mesobacillus maritimus]